MMRSLLDLAPHYHVHQQKPFHLNTAASVVIVFCGLGASISFMAAVALYFWCFKGRGAEADAANGNLLHDNPSAAAENKEIREKISRRVVEKLPLASFGSVCDKNRSSAECCSVCLTEFRDARELGPDAEEGLRIRQLPDCGHFFHTECIQMWLASYLSCPLCRSCSVANLIVEEDHRQQASTSAAEQETSAPAISPAGEAPVAEHHHYVVLEVESGAPGGEIGTSENPFKVNNNSVPGS